MWFWRLGKLRRLAPLPSSLHAKIPQLHGICTWHEPRHGMTAPGRIFPWLKLQINAFSLRCLSLSIFHWVWKSDHGAPRTSFLVHWTRQFGRSSPLVAPSSARRQHPHKKGHHEGSDARPGSDPSRHSFTLLNQVPTRYLYLFYSASPPALCRLAISTLGRTAP